MQGIEAARAATLGLRDGDGEHCGQGLLLSVGGEPVVLTCHHVVAAAGGEPWLDVDGEPVSATYDEQRSRAEGDTAVLRPSRAVAVPAAPRLHALDPRAYAGRLAAVGITVMAPRTFGGTLRASTSLTIEPRPGGPRRYTIASAFPLSDTTDARPGISGSTVVSEHGVVGLAHFARAEGAAHQREAYVLPLQSWADGWPELTALIEPFVDRSLASAATIRRTDRLAVGTDVVVAEYHPDLHVERDVDDEALDVLGDRGNLIITGRPRSGKTVLALESLRRRLPDALIVLPHSDTPPLEFEEAGLTGRELVLFVDDLHQTALGLDPLEWQRRLEVAAGRPCPIVCTCRDGHDWRAVRERPRIMRMLEQFGDAVVYTSQSGDYGHDLSQDEGRELAARLGLADEEFERRFDGTPGSLTLDLGAMRRRYERLREQQLGGIGLTRLLDSAKLLHIGDKRTLTLELVRAVAERIRGDGRLSGETWDALQRRAEEEGFARIDREHAELKVYRPYLEECIGYYPAQEEVEALADLLAEREDWDGVTGVARVLHMVLHSDKAETAARRAVAAGHTNAEWILAVVVAGAPQGQTEAEEIYRRQIQQGDTSAFNGLGIVLSQQPGREAEAEAAYRAYIDSGERGAGVAAFNLGELLARRPGREADAEQAYEEAIAAGMELALPRLGDLLAGRPGREAEAEAIYRRAIALPPRSDYHRMVVLESQERLGCLLADDPARAAEAEAELQKAVDGGREEARWPLGAHIANAFPDRLDDAERELRRAARRDDPQAKYTFAFFLERGDRLEEAQRWYEKAADEGHAGAASRLGRLLLEQDRRGDAHRRLTVAAEAGESDAALLLGWLARQDDDAEAMVRWYEQAAEAGQVEAALRLAEMLRESGRSEEADAWLSRAAETGSPHSTSPDMALHLARALASLEDRAGAERWARPAADAGDALASAFLGLLLLTTTDADLAEAEERLRFAAAAGETSAGFGLGMLCWADGRTEEAVACFREAALAGDPASATQLGLLLLSAGELPGVAEPWLRQAAEAGDDEAVEALAQLGL